MLNVIEVPRWMDGWWTVGLVGIGMRGGDDG